MDSAYMPSTRRDSRRRRPSEIERAYRRLARRYHPGINPGDRVAEEMFRQIQQALRRARAISSGGASTTAACVARRSVGRRGDASRSRDSISRRRPRARSRRRSRSCSPTCFRTRRAKRSRRARARRSEITLAPVVRGRRARRTVSDVRRAPGAVRDVQRRRARAAARVAVSRVRRAGHAGGGRAGTWCSPSRATLCEGSGRDHEPAVPRRAAARACSRAAKS